MRPENGELPSPIMRFVSVNIRQINGKERPRNADEQEKFEKFNIV